MGFETSLFAKPVDENLTCSLCLGVFDRPTLACSNGHVYCEGCLTKTKARRDACPDCRMSILDPAPLNRPVQNMIVGLKLCCEYSKPKSGGTNDDEAEEPPAARRRTVRSGAAVAGEEKKKQEEDVCNWQGLVSEYHEHAKSCDFRLVPCPLGCKSQIVHRLLEHHKVNECSHRTVACSACDEKLRHNSLEDHSRRYCPEGNVKCRFCIAKMKRKELGCKPFYCRECHADGEESPFTGHYKVCPRLPLQCEFFDMGCHKKVPRERMAAHHAEKARYHAQLLNNKIKENQDWEKMAIDWKIAKDCIQGIGCDAIDSPTVTIFGQPFFLRLHLDGPKIEIELCVSHSFCRRSDLTIRKVDIYFEVQHPTGEDRWFLARPAELEDGGKSKYLSRWTDSNSFGRSPFIFEYSEESYEEEDDNGDEGNGAQTLEVTRQMLLSSYIDEDVSFVVSFEVNRPSSVYLYSS